METISTSGTTHDVTPAGRDVTGQGITGTGQGITGTGQGTGGGVGPLIIQVHSARFMIDLGHLTKQDPYIKVKIGHHKEKTSAKTRAGKTATWDETLTFTNLETLELGTPRMVHITARDKNLFKNNTIGLTTIPLAELLRHQGQREIELCDEKDKSVLVGHVSITVSGGEGYNVQGLTSGHDNGLTSEHTEHGHHDPVRCGAVGTDIDTSAAVGTSLGHDHSLGHHGGGAGQTGSGNLAIQVHSAQFVRDHDLLSKQDPYILISIGDQTQRTKTKNRAGKVATWDETLNFTNLERFDGKSSTVHISARDKDIISDDYIGQITLPLPELLRHQGQHEYELFEPKDATTIAGRITLTVTADRYGTNLVTGETGNS